MSERSILRPEGEALINMSTDLYETHTGIALTKILVIKYLRVSTLTDLQGYKTRQNELRLAYLVSTIIDL